MEKQYLFWVLGLFVFQMGTPIVVKAVTNLNTKEMRLLHEAAEFGDASECRTLLDNHQNLIQFHDQNGFSLIHTVVASEEINSAQKIAMLQEFRSIFPVEAFYRSTTRSQGVLAHRQTPHGFISFPIDSKLLEKYLEEPNPRSLAIRLQKHAIVWTQESALILAIMRKDQEVVDFLLKNFDLNTWAKNTNASLMLPMEHYQSQHFALRPLQDSGIALILMAVATQGLWDSVKWIKTGDFQRLNQKGILNQNFFHSIAQIGFYHKALEDIPDTVHNQMNTSDLDLYHCSPLHLSCAQKVDSIYDALKNQNWEEVEAAINQDPSVLQNYDQTGFSLVHQLAYDGNVNILSQLKEKHPHLDLFQKTDERYQHFHNLHLSPQYLYSDDYKKDPHVNLSPFEIAIMRNQTSVADYLLKHIQSLGLTDIQAQKKLAIRTHQHEKGIEVQTLLKMIIKTQMWTTFELFIELFSQEKRTEFEKLLLEEMNGSGLHFSQLPKSVTEKMKNKVYEAAENTQEEQIKLLHNAIKKDNLQSIDDLLKGHPNLLYSRDSNGFNILHSAVSDVPSDASHPDLSNEQLATFNTLKEKYPQLLFEKTTTPIENSEGTSGWMHETVFSLAIMHRKESAALVLLRQYEIDSQKFYDKTIRSPEALSFKHLKWAVQGHMWTLAERLIDKLHTTEIYKTDEKGRNFLHIAADSGAFLPQLPASLFAKIDPLAFQVRDDAGKRPSDLQPNPLAHQIQQELDLQSMREYFEQSRAPTHTLERPSSPATVRDLENIPFLQ